MKPTIYHLSHIDLDGYSCQLIMEYTPYKVHSFNANYGAEVVERLNEILELLKKIGGDSLIFITDLNLTADEARWLKREVDRLNDKGQKVTITLRDHHGSGQESADKYDWYFLDTEKCATKLTYEYAKEFFELDAPEWMSKYVAVVDAVDLWHQDQVENFECGKVCMRLVTETRELNRVVFGDEDRKYKVALLKEAAQMVNVENANILLDEKIHALKKNFFREEADDTLDNLATKFIVNLLGTKMILPYRILWVVAVFTGTVLKLKFVWLLADTLNALMAIPNLIALVALSPIVFQLTRAHFATTPHKKDQ